MESHHYVTLLEQLASFKVEQWEKLAEGLKFHSFEIEGIKANLMLMMRGPMGCLGEVISQWIKWSPGDARGSQDRPTLEALKRAIELAGYPDAASNLSLS